MGNNDTWTERELAALTRNYPLHGGDVAEWDEPISRSRCGIVSKAATLGVPYVRRRYAKSQLTDEQHRKLCYVVRRLCKSLGVSMRVVAHEVAMIAYRQS